MVVGDIVRNNARNFPNKTGIVSNGKKFTWSETDKRSNSIANALLKLGLKKQEGVGILAQNGNEWVETAFAVAKAGLRLVPLNMAFVGRELSYIINNAKIKTLFVENSKASLINDIRFELKDVEHIVGIGEKHGFFLDYEEMIKSNSAKDPEVHVSPDDIFLLPYTSGTTGQAKGAMLTHANNIAEALCASLEFRLLPHYTALTALPLYFIGGWGGSALPALIRGCTHIFMSFEPEQLLKTIQNEKVNYTLLVPTMINMITNHPDVAKYDYSSLKVIPFAGSPLPVQFWIKAAKTFGNIFQSIYGLTEVCATITVLQPEEVHPEGDEKQQQRLASIGKPMIGSSARVVDEDMNDVKPGSDQVGEIVLRGNTVMKGYWKDPETTKETFRGGWLHTGDLARVDEDGNIYITDRQKDMIISGGKNVYPREIEEVLYKHPAVLDACVIGIPDDKWGETVKAVVVLREGHSTTSEEIIEFCKQNLASYKKPTSVDMVQALPRTSSGKILKRALREQYWKGRDSKLV